MMPGASRSDRKASVPPSGDHFGAASIPGPADRTSSLPLAVSTRQMRCGRVPSSFSAKMPLPAIVFPSGDHCGQYSFSSPVVNRTGAPPLNIFTWMANFASGVRCQANATWLPSGENVGCCSRPSSAVRGTALIAVAGAVPVRAREPIHSDRAAIATPAAARTTHRMDLGLPFGAVCSPLAEPSFNSTKATRKSAMV